MISGTDVLEALPTAVYTTDADGRITFYNQAAADLWGHRPTIGSDSWCGSWRLYWPDGRPMRHDECPMAIALKEGREVRGVEAIAERPDGTRVPFMPLPTPLRDKAGQVIGGLNLLIDLTERKQAEIDSARLAAIIEGSDDAIISKTLEGCVTSWNAAATRIFGYTPEEMIGEPIIRIIPPELRGEEEEILASLKRGERVDHFDTVRVTKDGRRINVSLTISPVRDRAGTIVGASKVGRDVTERKRAEELQRLLFDELNHRVKNTLAIIQAIAGQSLRRSASPDEFVASFSGRVQALARAHDLLVQGEMKGAPVTDIVRDQVVLDSSDGSRISYSGPSWFLDARAAVQLALVLHELATNARKYGALSAPSGQLSIDWSVEMRDKPELLLEWRERGVRMVKAPQSRGFGTTLIERTIEASGGKATIRYEAGGLICRIRLPLPEEGRQTADFHTAHPKGDGHVEHGREIAPLDLRGKRILLIEDEPLIAMEIESYLEAAGCDIVGPAGTVKRALQLVAEARFDAALLDANLGGHTVSEVAVALAQKNIPFAFATGYGPGALPRGFQDAMVLTKPFGESQVLAAIKALLARPRRSPDVLAFRPRGS